MARPQAPVGASKVPPGLVDHRKRLEALRDLLTDAVADAGPRDLAALAARLQAVLSELAGLPAAEGSDGIDDLSAARRRRRSGSAAS